MGNDIKAIETRYKGYRFRSRLEARWAVFFDALGIRWEYEPEGFDLGEAGWYLPDFYFPGTDWYAEVKPDKNISDSDAAKMSAFDSHPPEGAMGLISLIGAPTMFYDSYHPERAEQSTWHLCARMGFFLHSHKDKIESAVTAARSARFEHGEQQFGG